MDSKIEQIKQWHEYHGSCVDALLKGAITLEEFNLHEDEFDRFFDSLYSSQEPQSVSTSTEGMELTIKEILLGAERFERMQKQYEDKMAMEEGKARMESESMWRPDNWNNPYIKDDNHIAVVTDVQGTRNLMHNAFENGANTMLEALRAKEIIAALYSSQEPQSVSTPTEGMELSSDDIDHEFIKYPQLKPPGVTLHCCIKDILRLQVAKVLKNLPTEQEIRESERKEIGEWLWKKFNGKTDIYPNARDIFQLKSGQSPKEV